MVEARNIGNGIYSAGKAAPREGEEVQFKKVTTETVESREFSDCAGHLVDAINTITSNNMQKTVDLIGKACEKYKAEATTDDFTFFVSAFDLMNNDAAKEQMAEVLSAIESNGISDVADAIRKKHNL